MTPGDDGHRGFWTMLGRPEHEALLKVADPISYPQGKLIFHEGEPSTFAFVIKAGWVMVTSDETALALRGCGDLVGESVSTHSPRSNTVIALSEIDALMITAHHLSALQRDHPMVGQALQRTHRDRRIESDRKRMDAGRMNSDKRLAHLFLELAGEPCGDPGREIVLDIPISQKVFGQLIGASTGTVERTLRNWRRRGIVATSYRRLALRDMPALRRIAGIVDA